MLSSALEQRLTRIAQQRGRSLEELLTAFADQSERTDFPGDPFHFFELSVAMICVTDLHGNMLYVNPAFYRALGYERDTLLRHPYKNFVHPDDVAATRTAEAELLAGQDIIFFENRYRCQDGSYRWLTWASTVNSQYVYGVALDVTEQKFMKAQLENALDQNRRMLRSMFDGYLLGDVDGHILEVNSAYCQMIGYSREELLQMKVFDLDPTAAPDEMVANAQRIIDDDVVIVIESRHQHKDGHLIDVELNTFQLEDGRIAGFVRDISPRKRLEQQLRRSEQLYRGLVESQIDFVCRYTPDTTLTYVNDAYCRFFRRSRAELIGTSFLTLTPGINAGPIMARIREVQADPAPDVRIFHTYNAAGDKQWIQWIDYGITDDTGTVVEIQAVGRDVTALIESQERLTEREEMLSTIFRSIPVLLAQFDQEGRFEYVNQHWVDILGWTVPEMRANPDIMAEFYPDPAYRQSAIEYMISGVTGWRDFKTRARNGRIIDIAWANVDLADGRKLGIGQVITQRIELENQRLYASELEAELEKERELREMKDRFVSLISHEFRTPLAVMTSSIDLITHYHERLSPDRVHSRLADIQRQIERMVDLMEDSLRFSKSSAGKTEFEPQMVAVRPFCQNIIDMLALTDDDRHEIVLQAADFQLRADPRLLEHALSNLIANALKYSPAGTTVSVQATCGADTCQFRVVDAGIGIPEADIPKLFEPFFRASNARHQPGTGLGLSIVRDYVELHGGTVSVTSVVGQGTTFTITLPVN